MPIPSSPTLREQSSVGAAYMLLTPRLPRTERSSNATRITRAWQHNQSIHFRNREQRAGHANEVDTFPFQIFVCCQDYDHY